MWCIGMHPTWLRASQVIESTTERSESKSVSAEEPVTTRIRRRMENFETNDGIAGAISGSIAGHGHVV